eukprot:c23586_g1_i3 orf=526-1206(+)
MEEGNETVKRDDNSLLGELHFETLDSGRLRCVETGHELTQAQKASYQQSRKGRFILFDVALAQGRPCLKFFEQSPVARDKVICTLTGDTINKTEDALWKHMNGKKFQRKLAEKEREKEKTRSNCASAKNADEDCSTDIEEPEFWCPPGDQLDVDDENDKRASATIHKKGNNESCTLIDAIKAEDPFSIDEHGSDDGIIIRTKRLSIGARHRKFGKCKKKRKTKDSG